MWDDDVDEQLLQALEESRRHYEEVELPRLSQQLCNSSSSSKRTTDFQPATNPSNLLEPESSTFKKPSLPPSSHSRDDSPTEDFYDGPEAEGFSFKAGKFWTYPTSEKYPVRTYQKAIVEKALFNNTLVSLPTGLGKTFIAAVVMYNYYVWYPKGKIIFMAPTKPLVAQQIENCINIMGIPESHTAEMTGAIHSKLRAGTWKEKRVFFLTPQVVQNDLSANICPANDVKCVVIDEAHRALGDHAYAQVIRLLNSYEARFRVLALSATPGSDLEAVQKVVSNLMINHIELRSEESSDIVQYTHQRNVELMVVDVGPTINRIKARYVAIASEYASRLQQRKILFGNVGSIPKFTVLKEWENFRNQGSNGMDPASVSQINCDFSVVHTLIHGLELLQTYGLRLLLNHLKGAINKNDPASNRLKVNEELKTLMQDVESILNPIEIDDENTEAKKRFIYGHPKLDRLQEVVVSHFEMFQQRGSATRVIVFCEYREGVIEICDMLKHFEPLVKPVIFMGQSAGKTSKGISQKQQLEIMEKFKRGVYNTLISTSVGEEGLDIGEVDLIICFDAKNSPIRQVQRMGRTGRKRAGRIIMLVTRGKEEQKYNQGLFKKKSVSAVLLSRENLAQHLYEDCPRMLPPGIEPKYVEREIVPAPSKPKSNQQDLRKMFLKRTAGGSADGGKSPGVRLFGKVSTLSEEDYEVVKGMNFNFERIPSRSEFWSRTNDEIRDPDVSPNNIDLATYIEFMRYQQRTHVVGNSSDSMILTELLSWSEERGEHEHVAVGGASLSQVTSTQIWPGKQRKRGRPPLFNSKPANPPKKRGRPKKEDCSSPAAPKENVDPNEGHENQASKPKSKLLFIEDEEDLTNTPETLKSPIFRRPNSTMVSPIIKCDAIPQDDIVTIDSDDEGDLNVSSSSGFAYLASQPSRQDLYYALSKALKIPPVEIEECDICDNLFSCKSLNKLVLKRCEEVEKISWEDVNKSLEDVAKIVPKLTNSFSKLKMGNFNAGGGSQGVFSLIPKLDFEIDDEMNGGLLCGGVGDLTGQAVYLPSQIKVNVDQEKAVCSVGDVPPADSMSSQEKVNIDQEELGSSVVEKVDFKTGISKTDVKCAEDDASGSCISPNKNSVVYQDLGHQFEDSSFDFLGLSKMDDIFLSQNDKNEKRNLVASDRTLVDIEESSRLPFEHNKETLKDAFTSQIERETAEEPSLKSKENSLKLKKDQSNVTTPKKSPNKEREQLSPILCSQVSKKPRLTLKLRKISDSLGKEKGKELNETSSKSKLGIKDLQIIRNNDDKAVTSSSQMTSCDKGSSPPSGTFDLFDDSLFLPPHEAKSIKSKVDENLKEAIRKKALEAKAREPEITFTQELKEMCDTSIGGLTQIFDMFEKKTKEKSPDVRIERADSSSSPTRMKQQAVSPSSTLSTDDELNVGKLNDPNEDLWGSEEDLFADCFDSNLCKADSSVAEKLPTAEVQISSNNVILDLGKDDTCLIKQDNIVNNQHLEFFLAENADIVNVGKDDEGKVLFQRSPSPVFKPSQIVKRPSKLSLRRKRVETVNKVELAVEVKEKSEDKEILQLKEDSEKPTVKNSKEEADFLPTDFSVYGDEFNNSWLYSQSCDTSKLIPQETANNGISSDKRSLLEGNLKTTALEDTKAAGSSSAFKDLSLFDDDDLEAAFAKLDAAREEQKQSVRLSSSSTPKPQKRNNLKANSLSVPTVKQKEDKKEVVIVLSSSDEEDSIPQYKKKVKKPALNITSSSEEMGLPKRDESTESCILSKKRKLSSMQLSSSNESLEGTGWLCAKKKKVDLQEKKRNKAIMRNKSLDLSTFCDDTLLEALNDEDNEQSVSHAKMKTKELSSDDDVFQRNSKRSMKTKVKKKRQKKSNKGNGFILSEAEESEDGERRSSDGESTSLDELDSSFINDSQPEATQACVDMHAKYLQSVRSPAKPGRFKMPNRLPQINMDIYSQYPDASELNQSYSNDSFCVDEATQYENSEMSLLEIAEAKLKAERKEKRKNRKGLKHDKPPANVCHLRKQVLESDESDDGLIHTKKRLKRIHVLEDSVCEDAGDQNPIVPATEAKEVIPSLNSRMGNGIASPVAEINLGTKDEFAQLLDDDLDFSSILDVPDFPKDEVGKTLGQCKSANFVKKVPLMSNGGFITGNSVPSIVKPTGSNQPASIVNSRPSSSVNISHQKVVNADIPPRILIIASSKQVATSTDIFRILRTNHRVHFVPRPIPDADFILSWRLGVNRIFVSDLKDRKKLEVQIKNLKESFVKPYCIVEKDRVKLLATNSFQNKKSKLKGGPQANTASALPSVPQSFWKSPVCCSNAALLRQAGIHLLFSQNKDETADFLAKLAKKETGAGHGISELAQDWSEEVDSRLQFFSSLPGVNLAFAIKLLGKFSTLSEFFERCSSVRDISNTLGLDVDVARKIHNLLCEVHVSP